ncbi:hypothetical protein P4S72_13860 [Vibrio sp. PP-XX7]
MDKHIRAVGWQASQKHPIHRKADNTAGWREYNSKGSSGNTSNVSSRLSNAFAK